MEETEMQSMRESFNDIVKCYTEVEGGGNDEEEDEDV